MSPDGQAGRRVHLDHAASSPLRPVAGQAMMATANIVGNPSALHASGRHARAVLEDAREQLAAAVGAHPMEVVFTASGSEADSIALFGASQRPGRPTLLIGATEHAGVASARGRIEGVQLLAVDGDGVVRPESLAASLDERTALVSVQTVNNETGTIQPVAQLAELARSRGAWFHTDAVQALGHVPFDFAALGLDLASLSAHKVGGPVGIGALLVRRGVELAPYGLGGAQEGRIRSGTVPVMLAAGFAAAAHQAVTELEREVVRLSQLRESLVQGIVGSIPDVRVNGGASTSPAIVHVTFAGTSADDVLLLLDQAGIDCSTGAACRAGVHQPSEVLLAMGRSLADASASIRFSFGPSTTGSDIERTLAVLPDVVSRARVAFVRG